jgi:hypothetical protein
MSASAIGPTSPFAVLWYLRSFSRIVLFDVFIWNFSCTLVDRFTPLGLGWLVPRFALVDRLVVIKSLYGHTAAWPRLGREDVRNAALQGPVAFAAVHVVEPRLDRGCTKKRTKNYQKRTQNVPIAYQGCTSGVPRPHRYCTKNVPKKYQKRTQHIQAVPVVYQG